MEFQAGEVVDLTTYRNQRRSTPEQRRARGARQLKWAVLVVLGLSLLLRGKA